MVACCKGFINIVYGLHSCPFLDINHQDNEGNTALMIASQAGKSHKTPHKAKHASWKHWDAPTVVRWATNKMQHVSVWINWKKTKIVFIFTWLMCTKKFVCRMDHCSKKSTYSAVLLIWFLISAVRFVDSRSHQHSHVSPQLLFWCRHWSEGLPRFHRPHQSLHDWPHWCRGCPCYGWYVRAGTMLWKMMNYLAANLLTLITSY